ncbi:MAG: Enzymatic protein of unknown function [Thermoleophilia bacterium]|nr:Enzymatic protein of unknown function [Thermoleophilia bacterium]
MTSSWPKDAPSGTIGVEEEFFLVDPASGAPTPIVEGVLAGGTAGTREFVQELVEGCTDVCTSADDVLGELVQLRAELGTAAARHGSSIAGVGAHAFARPEDLLLTETARYREMSDSLPWTWREATTCGMHVHIGVHDPDVAIQVCDRLRSYLPVLLAMSVNSPLWRGQRTGLASIRTVLRRLQPRTGLPPRHGSWARYVQRMDALAAAGVPDGSWTWWGVRPHPTHGTVELRVFDTQSDVRNAHALASLAAALVAHLQRTDADPFTVADETLLEENWWNAMRGGVAGRHLMDGDNGYRTQLLGDSAFELLDLLDDQLADDVVARLRTLALCPEADRQLADFEEGGCRRAMRAAAQRTMESCVAAFPTVG